MSYRSTGNSIVAGFHEFFLTTTNYAAAISSRLSSITLVNKTVAVLSIVVSSFLIAISRRPRTRKMELEVKTRKASDETSILQKMKKWKLIKLILLCAERTLNAVEYLITPSNLAKNKCSPKVDFTQIKQSPRVDYVRIKAFSSSETPLTNGIPVLLNLRHISDSNKEETPNNNVKLSSESDDWTPFSSVSSNGMDRTSACVSLMDDLSQSTISTPMSDLRQQMALKIRNWRHAIKDFEGTPEFPSWSPTPEPKCGKDKQKSGLGKFWSSLTMWIPFIAAGTDTYPHVGSARKRKRIDGDEDDDDLSLYIPHHKSQPKCTIKDHLMNEDIAPAKSTPTTAEVHPPGIRGLSVVPIIGNWFTSSESPFLKERPPVICEQDHIALVQRDFLSPSKRLSPHSSNCSTSDTDPGYEILDMEAKVINDGETTDELSSVQQPKSNVSSSDGSESE